MTTVFLAFIKMNDPPEEMHLLTYSSFHALIVNSQLPVSPAVFLAAESISIKKLVSGFTASNIFAEAYCQSFGCRSVLSLLSVSHSLS